MECVLRVPQVTNLTGKSFQSLIVRQPVKLGGLGLRSLKKTAYVAFLGGIEMSVPHMVALENDEPNLGICQQLQEVVGEVRGVERWREFLLAGSRTSVEFCEDWNSLAGEANSLWQFLERDASGVLAAESEGAGGNEVDGSIRKKVTEQQEGLRHEFLLQALSQHPDRDARPVRVYPNISDDKVAGRWLLAIPGSNLSISSSAFKEAISANLCLPSPAIVNGGWVGQPVGQRGERIDKFGDNVVNCHIIFGDTWRHRHDNIKQHIVAEAVLSGIHVDCEVYRLFSDLLPAALQEQGGELQWGRARQGVIPDFKFLLASHQGPKSFLAELKCINANRRWYPNGDRITKRTDKRAGLLSNEYEAKLRKFDVRFHGTEPLVRGQPQPAPGPLVQCFCGFEFLKLVAGPWGDLSRDFRVLLWTLAEKRVESSSRAEGRFSSGGELGKVMGDIRRALSVEIVRGQALCLLDRLLHLGPGAKRAGERRELVQNLEYSVGSRHRPIT